MDPFIGQIIMFAGNFAPRGWAFCEGQLLAISTHQALFSILGTTYGGDGRTTFALPDLRGRAPIAPGQGPGLSPYRWGQRGGAETVTLQVSQIPPHTHTAQTTAKLYGQSEPGDDDVLGPNVVLASGSGTSSEVYSSEGANTQLREDSIAAQTTVYNQGGGQWHANIQPFLALHYIIALQGVFPSRS